MCFEFDARPPDLPADLALPPCAGGAAAEIAEVTSADGARFSAALAPVDGDGAAVVILPDVRGLYPFYVELAERFAQAGHPAAAIDYFGRTAGLGPRGEDFDYMPEVLKTRPAQIRDDAAAALAALAERSGERPAVAVGFCFGGTQAFLANASSRVDLAGVVGFYGGLDMSRWGDIKSPAEMAGEMHGAVLGLFGGADQSIPPEQVAAFEQALTDAGVEHEIVTYPGAPHSFFDRSYREHAEACEDAWRRVLGFLDSVSS
jgi:carboxymethylenebutenolidase